MKHISKDAYLKNDSALVLALSSEAREKKAKGIKVIDATIGMLLNDKGELSSFSLMNKAAKKAMELDNRKYTSVTGNPKFKENIINWLFKDSPKCKNKYSYRVCASMGGTGALMLAVRNYLDKSSNLLIPDVGWANYVSIAEQSERKVSRYQIFKDNKFNIDGIKESINKEIKLNKKATIIINDPCQNPSGYSISISEWKELISFFNNVNKKYPLTLILDVAYMDYSNNDRTYFKLIEKMKAEYLTLVTYSASKTLSVYGLRLGALVAIGEEADMEDFVTSSIATSRATWSSPNANAIALFNIALGNKDNYVYFKNYAKKQNKVLAIRYKKARKLFDKLIVGGTPLPYVEGFFLTYKVNNANALADKLKKKNIYVLPMQDKYIRIAICSLTNL